MAKKSKVESFSEDAYRNINIDHLVLYAAKAVLDNGEECTFERLVCESFTLFPGKFSFIRYPQWPDAARINKAWLRCRTDKGWLAGTVKEGFSLTRSGELAAKRAENELRGGGAGKVRPSKKTRERYETLLAYVHSSPQLKRFQEHGADAISMSDLRTFLRATLETPKRILTHNLNQYLEAARIYGDDDVNPFLSLCKTMLRPVKE